MPKASNFGGRGHIPLLHPPPMASKAGHARLCHRLLLLQHSRPWACSLRKVLKFTASETASLMKTLATSLGMLPQESFETYSF